MLLYFPSSCFHVFHYLQQIRDCSRGWSLKGSIKSLCKLNCINDARDLIGWKTFFGAELFGSPSLRVLYMRGYNYTLCSLSRDISTCFYCQLFITALEFTERFLLAFIKERFLDMSIHVCVSLLMQSWLTVCWCSAWVRVWWKLHSRSFSPALISFSLCHTH